MIFRENSFLARLWQWFYRNDSLPATLCPYFWSLLWAVIAAPFKIVFNIPFWTVFESPSIYFNLLNTSEREDENVQSLVGWVIFVIGLCMLSTLSILFNGFPHIDGAWYPFVVVGLGVATGLLLFGIGYGIYILRKDINNHLDVERREGHTPAIDIITGFAHAKYNKYCPKINWTQKE
tara:strand:- start:263 stop:796 length:534 start_codon:yes stop_codon:yes gene_type:complete